MYRDEWNIPHHILLTKSGGEISQSWYISDRYPGWKSVLKQMIIYNELPTKRVAYEQAKCEGLSQFLLFFWLDILYNTECCTHQIVSRAATAYSQQRISDTPV